MSEWSRERRHVSRAYDDWCLVEADIRAFLNLTVQWVTSAHEDAWAAAQAEADRVFDPDRHDIDLPVGFYEEKTSQLWSQNHLWMVNAAALKDAVTAFEVYLEKSALEVVGRYGFQFSTGRLESPPLVAAQGGSRGPRHQDRPRSRAVRQVAASSADTPARRAPHPRVTREVRS